MRRCKSAFMAATILAQLMPLAAIAGTGDTVFKLPPGRVDQQYNLSLVDILKSYGWKVEAGSGSRFFRWSLDGAGNPPPAGLTITADGFVTGTPTKATDGVDVFSVKVPDTSGRSDSLIVDFSIEVKTARVRLTAIGNGGDPPAAPAPAAKDSAADARVRLAPADPQGEETADPSKKLYGASGPDEAPRGKSAWDITGLPSIPAYMKRVVVDARTGEWSCIDAEGRAYSCHQFSKGQQVAVVITNKNPFRFKYSYESTSIPATESAIVESESLLGVPSVGSSDLGNLTASGQRTTTDALVKRAPLDRQADQAGGPGRTLHAQILVPDPCATLNSFKKAIEDDLASAHSDYNTLARIAQSYALQTGDFKRNLDEVFRDLLDAYKPSQELFKESQDYASIASSKKPGLDLEALNSSIDKAAITAANLEARIRSLAQEDSKSPTRCLSAEDMLVKERFVRNLMTGIDKQRTAVKAISALLDAADQNRKAVEAILSRPDSFTEVHAEGNFDQSTTVDFTLTKTPIDPSGGGSTTIRASVGADPGASADPAPAGASAAKPAAAKASPPSSTYTGEFKFGDGPFFSLSGGLAASPLGKIQYGAIQGFSLSSDGSQVLTNGKPTITSVVGITEKSPNRISPMIFLNGRLFNFDRRSNFFSGIHMTLGVTGKPDNKGTDIDFLLGPSLSFLDNNLFFTGGAYGGRDQHLAGGIVQRTRPRPGHNAHREQEL